MKMFKRLQDSIRPSKGSSLARSFSRLGWTSFWLQVVFGSLPLFVMVAYFVFSSTGPVSRAGLPFVEYLTILNLLLLGFTIIWSYRYTRLGKRLLDPERAPSESSVIGIVWTGVTASTVSMLFSMIVILIETANMLFFFLKAPQGGIPAIQTSGAESRHWVSTADMVSLMALTLMLFAELIVLMISLWLLFRTTLGSPEFPQAGEGGMTGERNEPKDAPPPNVGTKTP
jgi:hypothetical protein